MPAAVIVVLTVAVCAALGVSAFVLLGGTQGAQPAAESASVAVSLVPGTSSSPSSAAASDNPQTSADSAMTTPGAATAPTGTSTVDTYGDTIATLMSGATGSALSVSSGSQANRSGEVTMASVDASSVLPVDVNGSTYVPSNVLDGNFSTAWVEGASGDGPGQYLVFKVPDGATVSKLTVAAGYLKSEKLYYENARPKQVTVIADGEVIGTASLDDAFATWQTIDLGTSVSPKTIALRIDASYAGSAYDDCCISELYWTR